jgi:YD repeat-containing protein
MMGWQLGDFYLPFTTLECERGKLIVQYAYNPSDVPLNQTTYTFRNDAARFNNSANIVESEGLYNYVVPDQENGIFCAAGIEFVSARSVYTYDYYPMTKTVVAYDQTGANPLTTVENYKYNVNNLLSDRKMTNSKGELLETTFLYPTEFTTAPYTSMVSANIVDPVIQETNTNNTAPTHAYTTTYMSSNSTYVPQYYQEQVRSNPVETREQVNQYDAFGHPVEIQKPNGVLEAYIWGYNSQYLVAKVTGSGYNAAIAYVNTTILSEVGSGNYSWTDNDVRAQITSLRTNLPNALVNGYTYACGVGVTSTVDPQGRINYYEYDLFSRLIDIKDQDQNIVKRYCYNYTGQTDACPAPGFGNQATQQLPYTGKETCGTGTTPATINYSIPANTYYAADQTTANNLASAAQVAQGQALANSLPCLAEVTGTNATAFAFTATFTNVSTGAVSSSGVYPAYSNTPLLPLPVGTYNLSLTSTTGYAILTYGGNTYSGNNMSVPNISVSAPLSLTLEPDNSGPCAITMASGYSSPSKGITNNGSTVSFYMAFYSSAAMSPGVTYYVANISGACMPSAIRTINTSSGGRNWLVTVYPDGEVSWQMTSGTTVNAGSTVGGNTLTYSH